MPSYYEKYGGSLISAAIDKYVYVSVNHPFKKGVFLKYSKLEHVEQFKEIQHPIIREVLQILGTNPPQIEITSLADVPSGTGLGSSGSFTTALIKALTSYNKMQISAEELAELACEIEIVRLKEPVGKQDQYISAFGGISEFEFQQDGKVNVSPLDLKPDVVHDLEDNLLLFFTGQSRSASTILVDQDTKSKGNVSSMTENLHVTKELGFRSKEALIKGNTIEFGQLMNEHWMYKKSRSQSISNSFIDSTYSRALDSGAIGGKLVGAGGGGFLMLYASDKENLRSEMTKQGMQEVRFRFDFEGAKVILS